MSASGCPDLKYAKPEPRARTRAKTVKARESAEDRVYRLVDQRDKGRCRLTGRRGDPYSVDPLDRLHHHHIVERSRGGETSTSNIVSVHRTVHDLIHESRVHVVGDADEQLTWTIKADAVLEAFGRKRVPLGVRVVPDQDWLQFILTDGRGA